MPNVLKLVLYSVQTGVDYDSAQTTKHNGLTLMSKIKLVCHRSLGDNIYDPCL